MTRAPRVAFDIGGTFTDIIVINAEGKLTTFKVLSLPEQIGAEVRRSVASAIGPGGAELASLVHGTTIGSNTLLEGKGAVTGLLTTRGFRDELEIRRMARPPVFDFLWERTPPLIPRRRRLEVSERITAQGGIFLPLDQAEARQMITLLKGEGVEAIAICLINSFANPIHEQQLAALARELAPEAMVSVSHEVLPELREYERTSTTAVNACLMPIVNRYLNSLEQELGGYARGLRIMQSNGGVMTAEHARHYPMHLIESGPAAGALAAAALTKEIGIEHAVSFDMGGTTVKACLIERNTPIEKNEMEVGGAAHAAARFRRGAGYALSIPALDIVEAGAGGGSIAWIDESGALRVGPVSAGAAPGPACYGLGGTKPTITDANVVLGYMNPHAIAGGTVAIDRGAASETIVRELGSRLGMTLQQAAYGVYQVANAAMTRAIRAVTTERGRDPRDYALIAFGGAGPIHAADLASSLGMKKVCIPLLPGLFSALGLMMADLRYDYVQSIPGRLDALDVDELRNRYDALVRKVAAELKTEKIDPQLVKLQQLMDLRYQRQTSELTLVVPDPLPASSFATAMTTLFHEEHERIYGYARREEPIAVVNLRLKAFAPTSIISFRELADYSEGSLTNPEHTDETRTAYFGPAFGEQPTRILSRDRLQGGSIKGPLVLEEFDTTIVVPPKWTASLDGLGDVILTFE